MTGPILPAGLESKVEQYLNRNCFAPPPLQEGKRLERHGDRFSCGIGARLQRNHHRVDVREIKAGLGNADRLDGPHALPRQHQRKVGGSGQVVGNGAQKHGSLR